MMKRIVCFLLILILTVSLVGCAGNFGKIELRDNYKIPDDGIISEQIIRALRDENAIATFQGSTGGMDYTWTIFGSDIEKSKRIDLGVTLTASDDGLRVAFSTEEGFGFPALLSITLKEKWNALSANVCQNGKIVATASLTGSKDDTVINIRVNDLVGEYLVVPTVQDEDPSVGDRPTSDGLQATQDKYLTDPVPEGQPLPVEPEDQDVNKEKTYTCTFSIECATILNNLSDLDPEKRECVPSDGIILATMTVTFYEGESVFDVLQRVCKEQGIQMEASWTPIYNSAYVEGIHNLYEFDCGSLSGWMYRVNGWYPNYGCSRYGLKQGDVVEWRYTCDLGADVGCEWMG